MTLLPLLYEAPGAVIGAMSCLDWAPQKSKFRSRDRPNLRWCGARRPELLSQNGSAATCKASRRNSLRAPEPHALRLILKWTTGI